jgi:predicted esterase
VTADLGYVHVYAAARAAGLPTLLLLHGTGGDERDLLPVGQALLPGAGLLAPRGDVRENGMPRFFRRLAVGVFDEVDLRTRAAALADFVARAAAAYGFDPHRVIAVGYSNGANVAAAILLLHPTTLSGAVLFHAQTPLVPDTLPALTGTHVLLTAGQSDPIVPVAEANRLAVLLRACGADVTLHWLPGGHALDSADIDAARAWIARRSAGEPKGAASAIDEPP